jgi:flagellar hook-basal body complex protein FliE
MAIVPIAAISQIAVPTAVQPAAASTAGAGADFGQMLSNAIDNVSATQNKADGLAVQAATGSLTDVHDYMIASTEASLTTDLAVAVRDKAVDAFNEIMKMPI